MRPFLIGITAVATFAAIGPVSAQVLPPGALQPSTLYLAQRYPFPGVSPEDAYRDGVINRWQLEQYEGPTPQALQGPNPSGNKGNQGGRGR